jgi:hypothetical protein
MGVGSLGQPIELDLGRANSACPIKLNNTLEKPTTTFNGRPQRRYIGTFWPRRLCAGGDESRSAAWLEHRERSLRRIAPDRVENSVTIGNSPREITKVVIDN